MESLSSDRLEKNRKQNFEMIFQKEIYPRFFNDLKKPNNSQSKVIFIGGQPGSGKSVRERYIVSALNLHEPNTAIEINGDDFRAFHPDYYSFLVADDASAASKIDQDNKFFIESSINASLNIGAHVVIEGTFRQADVVRSTAALFAEHSYTSEAILLVVHPIISRIGIMRRYFEQKSISPFARYTKLSAHNASLDGIENTIKTLAEDALVERLQLITRCGEPLMNICLSDKTAPSLQLISETAVNIINDNWTHFSEQDKTFANHELAIIDHMAQGITIPDQIISDLNDLKTLVNTTTIDN